MNAAVSQHAARADDRLDCAETTLRFFRLLDASDNTGCVAQFDAEGVWVRGPNALTGAAAITRALTARPAERRTCHLVTNIEVSFEAADEARVDFCLTAYEGTAGASAGAVPGRLAGIRRCVDRLVRRDGRWLIQHKSSTPLFE